ncbi:MAG: hypothetical protein ACPG7F_00570 [Aggregatilineales bacterium]
MKKRKLARGWYRIQTEETFYEVYQYDDGMWGVYAGTAKNGDCISVEKRLKDSYSIIQRHSSNGTPAESGYSPEPVLDIWDTEYVETNPASADLVLDFVEDRIEELRDEYGEIPYKDLVRLFKQHVDRIEQAKTDALKALRRELRECADEDYNASQGYQVLLDGTKVMLRAEDIEQAKQDCAILSRALNVVEGHLNQSGGAA